MHENCPPMKRAQFVLKVWSVAKRFCLDWFSRRHIEKQAPDQCHHYGIIHLIRNAKRIITNWIINCDFFFIMAFSPFGIIRLYEIYGRANKWCALLQTHNNENNNHPTADNRHSPMRMMSGRQLTEHKKIAIKIKWTKIGEKSTIFTQFDSAGSFFISMSLTQYDEIKFHIGKIFFWFK